MPACDARYDVILGDGFQTWNGFGQPETQAVVDFEEERLPDDWGEPGELLGARLVRYWTQNGKRLHYESIGTGPRKRMSLWADGSPIRARVKYRRYLRWKWIDYDPPVDPEFDDPA